MTQAAAEHADERAAVGPAEDAVSVCTVWPWLMDLTLMHPGKGLTLLSWETPRMAQHSSLQAAVDIKQPPVAPGWCPIQSLPQARKPQQRKSRVSRFTNLQV